MEEGTLTRVAISRVQAIDCMIIEGFFYFMIKQLDRCALNRIYPHYGYRLAWRRFVHCIVTKICFLFLVL